MWIEIQVQSPRPQQVLVAFTCSWNLREMAVLQFQGAACSQGPVSSRKAEGTGHSQSHFAKLGPILTVVGPSQQAGRLRKVWWQQMRVARGPQEGRRPH